MKHWPLLILLAACDKPAPASHGHHHTAPHGGTLIRLGDEFAHIELVLDSGKLTAYVLDGHAENAVRIEQKSLRISIDGVDVDLAGVENPLTGEKVGDTSEFTGQIKNVPRFTGRIPSVTIKGQTFKDVSFTFPEGNEK
jgi:hypothetical protein